MSQADKDNFLAKCREALATVPVGEDSVMGPPLADVMAQGYEFGSFLEIWNVELRHGTE
jgi:hypothetical protein